MDNWKETLPEGLREAPFIGKAESPEDALGKLQHAAKLVGTSVRIPDADASDEDKAKFYERLTAVDGVARMPTHDDIDGVVNLLKKLGYPDEHTAYKLPEAEDFEWDERMGEDLRKYAHQAGLTPGQFEAFARQIAEQERGANLQHEESLNESRKALRADWGDTLEAREDLIRGWLKHSDAPPSMVELLDNRELPLETMNWLLSTAKQFKDEANPISRDGRRHDEGKTPEQIKTEISQVLNDLTSMRESDPRYPGLKRKLVELHGLASGHRAA